MILPIQMKVSKVKNFTISTVSYKRNDIDIFETCLFNDDNNKSKVVSIDSSYPDGLISHNRWVDLTKSYDALKGIRALEEQPDQDESYHMDKVHIDRLSDICSALHEGNDKMRDLGHKLWLVLNELKSINGK